MEDEIKEESGVEDTSEGKDPEDLTKEDLEAVPV